MKLIERFFKNQSGATAIEYGLIATLIAMAIIGGLSMMAGANNNKYNAISNAISGAM